MNKRILAVVLLAALAGCSGSGGGNIVEVNGQNISKADFDQKLEAGPAGKQVLTQLVQQTLVDQYGRDNKIVVTQAEIDKKEADIKAKYPPGQFESILQQQGLTEADVQNILRQQIVIEKAIAPQIHISNADIVAYFNKNHALLDKPAQIRARHILVRDPQTAALVEQKLKAGGSFSDLAKQYSTDLSNKDKGGDLGFFGRGQMVKPFETAAFALPVGAISRPVKSPFGYHIIQVEEIRPATKATLAGSSAQIKDQLTQQAEAQQIPLFLQNLRTKANIVVYDQRFAALFPPPPPPPPSAAASTAAAAPAAPAASAAASSAAAPSAAPASPAAPTTP
jgi:foldase protein PrsA